LICQGDAKEEEDMSVDSDEEPHSYPITTPLSQSKNIKPPPTKMRVSLVFECCGVSLPQVLFGSSKNQQFPHFLQPNIPHNCSLFKYRLP